MRVGQPRKRIRIVHKDYGSGIPIQISVYEHQVVVWNPDQLPQDWTLERLLGKHPSTPYNPLIANAFFRTGYIEAWGRGIEKIHRECREYDIPPPVFDYGMSGLMLTFRANPQHLITAWGEQEAKRRMGEKVGEKVGEALTNNQRQILTLLHDNPRMAAREVAQRIGISSRKVEENIAKLKALKLLKRIGPAKESYWQVTEDQREGM